MKRRNHSALVSPEFLTRASAIAGFEALCGELGVDGVALLCQAGLTVAAIADPEARIPLRSYFEALNFAALASFRPDFGLLLEERQTLAMLGPIGLLAIEAPSLRVALENLNAYMHFRNNGVAMNLAARDGLAVWSHAYLMSDVQGGLAVAEDHTMATGMHILRRLVGPDWCPDYIRMVRPTPPDPARYRRKFGCDIEFGADVTEIAFASHYLDRQLAGSGWQLHDVLQRVLEHFREDDLGLPHTTIQVAIAQAIRDGDGSLQRVASILNMAPRSLQRRLAKAGTNFQCQLNFARNSVAQRYLRDTKLPMTEISILVGYADLAAFSHAFKRINGTSPQTWRETSRTP